MTTSMSCMTNDHFHIKVKVNSLHCVILPPIDGCVEGSKNLQNHNVFKDENEANTYFIIKM